MDEFLNFVTENYIWIIIIGIVILMTIIGYIADKTDFGKESLKKKKVKKEENIDEFDNNDEPNVTEAFKTDELEIPEQNETPSKKELRRMKKEEARKQKEEAKRQREEEKRQRVEELKKQREEERRLKEENLNNQENNVVNEQILNYNQENNAVNEQVPTYTQEELNNNGKEEIAEQPNNDMFNEPFSFDEPANKVEEPVQEEQINKFEEPEIYEHQEEKPELIEQSKEENPKLSEEPKEESKNDLEEIPEIELPSIESLDEELKDDEEDDVWKF